MPQAGQIERDSRAYAYERERLILRQDQEQSRVPKKHACHEDTRDVGRSANSKTLGQ